jgi:hypothetical protein
MGAAGSSASGDEMMAVVGQEFGPADTIPYWVSSYDLHPFAGGEMSHVLTYVHANNAGGSLVAPIQLPHGARILSWRICYYDAAEFADLRVRLMSRRLHLDGPPTFHIHQPFDSTGADGYASAFQGFDHTVDNFPGGQIAEAEAHYFIEAQFPIATGGLRLGGVRLLWKRQLGEPPETPTFEDVPASHPLYPFIEALYGSGISAGCADNPQRFCPDQPVTRGQMALFMARALGLHWPTP